MARALTSSPLSYFSGYFIDYESKLFGKNGASSLEQVAVSASLNNYIFIKKSIVYILYLNTSNRKWNETGGTNFVHFTSIMIKDA